MKIQIGKEESNSFIVQNIFMQEKRISIPNKQFLKNIEKIQQRKPLLMSFAMAK